MQPEKKTEGSHFHRVGRCGCGCCDGGDVLQCSSDHQSGVCRVGSLATVALIENEQLGVTGPDEPLDQFTVDRLGSPLAVNRVSVADLLVVDGLD